MGEYFSRWVAAVLYNGLGQYDKALDSAQGVREVFAMQVSAWALPELIEAASRTGQTRQAAEALDRLAAATDVGDSDWGHGIHARCRALLSEGEEAERCYREAAERLGRTRFPTELARAHLLYGEWLRREGRRADARTHLRTAYDSFTAIGMQAFAGRAHNELLATGETVRKRAADTPDQLTPQESQIARMARTGLSNSEIGAQLFLSPRTVEYHLGKVFAKLAITSRHQLTQALPGQGHDRP
ncbi:LuxR C-terminal-related transcriptional regulator [Nonomuraea rubra]|uniref:helix-turn-helix transcriptional regulator n=1 Tax=Nonomuraea rubra TaxID=46180 RepID=UPI00360718DE